MRKLGRKRKRERERKSPPRVIRASARTFARRGSSVFLTIFSFSLSLSLSLVPFVQPYSRTVDEPNCSESSR